MADRSYSSAAGSRVRTAESLSAIPLIIPRIGRRAALLCLLCVSIIPCQALAVTTYRITHAYLRDPHVIVGLSLFCYDVTDTPPIYGNKSFNEQLNAYLTADGNGDGLLDLSPLGQFLRVDPSASGGLVWVGGGDCAAPSGTPCAVLTANGKILAYTNSTSGSCLAPFPGTTSGYSPPIVTPSAPCFVTAPVDTVFNFGLFSVPLYSARLGATYVGNPPSSLINGLLLGFLSETDADAITANLGPWGTHSLSEILSGDRDCGSGDDRDVGPGGRIGWWLYVNFVAEEVASNQVLSVDAAREGMSLRLGSGFPNPFSARHATAIEYSLPTPGEVLLRVYDLGGRLVKVLVNEEQSAGKHSTSWSGLDQAGSGVSPGVYFLRLDQRGQGRVTKLLLVD